MSATESTNEGEEVQSVGQDDEGQNTGQQKLSKNQQRKLLRREMQLKHRPEKRKQERERRKQRRREAFEAGEDLPLCRKRLRKETKEPLDINVVIDCSFEEHMVENDIRKLVKQLQHCYAINRRAEQPFKYHATSYNGKTKEIIENLAGTHSWDIKWSDKLYTDVFPKEDIIYLSAESENVLDTLQTGKAYIIGGLVDHNNKKGLCHRLAVEQGIPHAQLPISQYIDLKCRKVLTIDHVFEILQKYQELKDWKTAFFTVIPKRKGAQEIESSSADNDQTGSTKAGDQGVDCGDAEGDNCKSDSSDRANSHTAEASDESGKRVSEMNGDNLTVSDGAQEPRSSY